MKSWSRASETVIAAGISSPPSRHATNRWSSSFRLVEGERVDLQASSLLPGQRFGTRLGIGKLAGLAQPLENLADERLPQNRRVRLRPRGRCGQEIGSKPSSVMSRL